MQISVASLYTKPIYRDIDAMSGFHLGGGGWGGSFPPPPKCPASPQKEKEKEKEKEREREGDRREVREQHIFGYYDIIRK